MLRFLTSGESHGKGLVMVIEGIPAGLELSEDYIAVDLRRRQGGYGRGRRQKIEQDRAEIIAGVRHGLTLGSPIALSIQNRDWANWTEAMSVDPVEGDVEKVTRLRPGHADLAGTIKYDFDDVRPILERASARETAARVAVGAVCKRFLEEFGMRFRSHTVQIGAVDAEIPVEIDWDAVEESPVRCADAASAESRAAVDRAACGRKRTGCHRGRRTWPHRTGWARHGGATNQLGYCGPTDIARSLALCTRSGAALRVSRRRGVGECTATSAGVERSAVFCQVQRQQWARRLCRVAAKLGLCRSPQFCRRRC